MKREAFTYLKTFAFWLLAGVAGCSFLNRLDLLRNELPIYKERPVKFPHLKHVKGSEADLDCEDCHPGAGEKVNMPSLRACRNCHGEKQEIERILKPFAPDGRHVKWTTVTSLPEDIKFSHRVHKEKGVACEECHAAVPKSKAVSRNFRISKDDCFLCHAKNTGLSRDCRVCHRTVNQETRPPSHEAAWRKNHGRVVREGREPPYTNRCSLCHSEASCSICHQDEQGKPESHDQFWRLRGHGTAAEMDRERCATCHVSDYCYRCHRETPPMNHTAAWGRPYDRHCLRCHLADQSNCNVCHEAQAGHEDAPAQPADQNHSLLITDCRTCHGSSLRHPDNGDPCEACHR